MIHLTNPQKRGGRHGICRTCLWHWPEVHGEEGFRCYCQESEHFHEEFSQGCRMHEKSLKETIRRLKLNWGEPGKNGKISVRGYGE